MGGRGSNSGLSASSLGGSGGGANLPPLVVPLASVQPQQSPVALQNQPAPPTPASLAPNAPPMGVTLSDVQQMDDTSMGVYLGSNAVDMQGGFVSGGSSGVKLQSKAVSPSESTQTVSPDSGYDGLSKVTVNAISSTYIGSDVTKKNAATYIPKTTDQSIASGQYLSGTQTIKGDANLVAGNIKSGVSIFGVTGTYASGGSSGGSGNNNVEAYAITDTNPSVSFKRTDGAIKIWGYGTMTSSSGWGGQSTSLIAFEGDRYHKSAMYGSPSSTNLSLSISNGKLSGLPSGLTTISAIVTRGI